MDERQERVERRGHVLHLLEHVLRAVRLGDFGVGQSLDDLHMDAARKARVIGSCKKQRRAQRGRALSMPPCTQEPNRLSPQRR